MPSIKVSRAQPIFLYASKHLDTRQPMNEFLKTRVHCTYDNAHQKKRKHIR